VRTSSFPPPCPSPSPIPPLLALPHVRTDGQRPRGHELRPREPGSLPPCPSCPPCLLLPPPCPPSHPHGRVAFAQRLEKKLFFGSCCLLEKKGKKCSVFGFQSPRSPSSPSSVGEAARRRRFFRPSSPSHPSKLYFSFGWLNSKVPKPFFPFTPRLIDVDGF
jgi:hypothetical protein